MSDICLVRQPVFGKTGALIGYEIRFNDTEDGQHAFARAFLSGSFDLVRNKMPAFVVATRAQLVEDAFLVAVPGTAIVMLPRDLELDEAVIEAVHRFRKAGGLVALDGLGTTAAPTESLLSLASWVRINGRSGDAAAIGAICARLQAQVRAEGLVKPPQLIAYNIEELAQFEATMQHGFDGFQGSFFSRPEPLPTAEMPQSTAAAMRLMGLARDPNCTDQRLEEVICTNPVLTFQLLRVVNSAALGGRGVASIGQALRLIGRNAFLRWLAVAVAATRESRTGVDQELVRQAVERGRLLEQLAGGGRDAGTLFLVGLFSLLDMVFRMPLEEILERVVLSNDAVQALLQREGPYANAIMFAESYELGLFENATEIARELGVDPTMISEYYTNAIVWTAEALGAALEQPAPARKAG